jgi:hypothetical protein
MGKGEGVGRRGRGVKPKLLGGLPGRARWRRGNVQRPTRLRKQHG